MTFLEKIQRVSIAQMTEVLGMLKNSYEFADTASPQDGRGDNPPCMQG